MADEILSDAHTGAIGRLVVAVSKIDTLLTDLAAIFLNTDILSAIAVFHHQQMASKIDTLKALLLLHSARGTTERAAKLLQEARDIADYRHSLVHGHLHISKEDGETYSTRFSARGELKRSRKPAPASHILAKALQADAVADRLAELRDHLYAQRASNRQS